MLFLKLCVVLHIHVKHQEFKRREVHSNVTSFCNYILLVRTFHPGIKTGHICSKKHLQAACCHNTNNSMFLRHDGNKLQIDKRTETNKGGFQEADSDIKGAAGTSN
ncbi:hypothetical protein GOODEAATRI_012069 [Goodea atripinnis]|uniref:Secreted protein n=1 Tax=Goodea atripinnis TaxID=208336 RepID=A0ABV0PMW0_9TELE